MIPVMPNASGKNKKATHTVGFWEAIRDIFVAMINKGQFLVALPALIIALIVYKMPGKDVADMASQITGDLYSGYLAGWVLAFVAIMGWYFHARYQRRMANREIKRICNERNRLQSEKVGSKLPSSKG